MDWAEISKNRHHCVQKTKTEDYIGENPQTAQNRTSETISDSAECNV